jgi:sulfur carrier protein ThiS
MTPIVSAGDIRKESLARIALRVHPPLSYKLTSERAGALILEQEIVPGETLADLLARLDSSNHEAWRNIFDVQSGQIQPAIMTFLNDTLLSHSVVSQTPLSDGDQVTLRIVYAGG